MKILQGATTRVSCPCGAVLEVERSDIRIAAAPCHWGSARQNWPAVTCPECSRDLLVPAAAGWNPNEESLQTYLGEVFVANAGQPAGQGLPRGHEDTWLYETGKRSP